MASDERVGLDDVLADHPPAEAPQPGRRLQRLDADRRQCWNAVAAEEQWSAMQNEAIDQAVTHERCGKPAASLDQQPCEAVLAKYLGRQNDIEATIRATLAAPNRHTGHVRMGRNYFRREVVRHY